MNMGRTEIGQGMNISYFRHQLQTQLWRLGLLAKCATEKLYKHSRQSEISHRAIQIQDLNANFLFRIL